MEVLFLVLLAFMMDGGATEFGARNQSPANVNASLGNGVTNITTIQVAATNATTSLKSSASSESSNHVVRIRKPPKQQLKIVTILPNNYDSSSKKDILNLPITSDNQPTNVPRGILPSRQRYIPDQVSPETSNQEHDYETQETNLPKMFAYSKSMSYSSSTGIVPKFSSTEQYTQLPLDDVQGAESGVNTQIQDHGGNKRRSDVNGGKTKNLKRTDCQLMQKPMPNYLHYKGKTSSANKHPMMTCYVCGKRDDPYSNGGYTEECDFSPTNRGDVYVNPGTVSSSDKFQDRYEPDLNIGASKRSHNLFAGHGQSPYLNRNYGDENKGTNSETSKRPASKSESETFFDENPSFREFIGDGGAGGDRAGDGGYGGNDDHDKDGNDHGDDHGSPQSAADNRCSVVYRGKMKCKICGDPKSDAVFDEQCDYEKDDPEQHHSRAYDHAGGSEKRYRSPSYEDDDHSDENYDDDGHGGKRDRGHRSARLYNDNYDEGTPTYDDSKSEQRNYDDEAGDESPGALRYEDENDGIGHKKDSDVDGQATSQEKSNGKKCKVVYKKPPYESPYDKGKKSKMRCLVCSGGELGETEECSYGASGSGNSGSEYPTASSEDSFRVDHYGHNLPDSVESLYDPFYSDGASEAVF